ncbi:MAG: hypothetical protein JWM87_668 [Candidatus Eremiobacteraeota bacterium]|nr:hypothetical protein [Candidatus Eremiobacteraeota bacterium]
MNAEMLDAAVAGAKEDDLRNARDTAASRVGFFQTELGALDRHDPRRPDAKRAWLAATEDLRTANRALRDFQRKRRRSGDIEAVSAVRAVREMRETVGVVTGYVADALDLLARWRGDSLPSSPEDCLRELAEALGEGEE